MPSGPSWFWFASRWQKWLWKRTKLPRDDIEWDIIFRLSCMKASLRTWMHIREFGGAIITNVGLWVILHLVLHERSGTSVEYSKRIIQACMLDPRQRGDPGTVVMFCALWLHLRDYQQAWPLLNRLSQQPFSPTSCCCKIQAIFLSKILRKSHTPSFPL